MTAEPATVPKPQSPASSAYHQPSETHKLTYDGGSLVNRKTGTSVKLFLDENRIHLVKNGSEVISLPAAAVTEISYGQDVHRRVVPRLAWQPFRSVSVR